MILQERSHHRSASNRGRVSEVSEASVRASLSLAIQRLLAHQRPDGAVSYYRADKRYYTQQIFKHFILQLQTIFSLFSEVTKIWRFFDPPTPLSRLNDCFIEAFTKCLKSGGFENGTLFRVSEIRTFWFRRFTVRTLILVIKDKVTFLDILIKNI